jgi:hypothetical protein
VDGGGDDPWLVEGPCVRSVSVAKELPVSRLNKDLKPLGFLVVSLLPLLADADVSQVPRGWPRSPWTNTILPTVSTLRAVCSSLILL